VIHARNTPFLLVRLRRVPPLLDSLIRFSRSVEQLHVSGYLVDRLGSELDRALHPVLTSVGQHPSGRVSDVASDLGLDTSTVSRHIARLVQLGLVRRSPGEADKREIRIALTKDGLALYKGLLAVWDELLGEALKDFSTTDRAAFLDLYEQFSKGFSRIAESTPAEAAS